MKCPLCGPSTVWNLASTAAITAEVVDVWDNAHVVGEQRATTRPDLSDMWANEQRNRLQMSYNWRHEHPNEMRVAGVEMATLRDLRFRMDGYRRADLKERRKGIHHLQVDHLKP